MGSSLTATLQDKCDMVNLPSLMGMDDSAVRGLMPRVGEGSGVRTGMVLGLGRSSFSSKTLQMGGQDFRGGKISTKI